MKSQFVAIQINSFELEAGKESTKLFKEGLKKIAEDSTNLKIRWFKPSEKED